MADPQLFATHELDPQVTESASATPGETATLQLLHRPTEAYQLDVHGFASGPVSVEEASCTDQARMWLPSGDTHYVISLPVRGAVLAMYRGKEFNLRPGQAMVFQPPAEALMTTDDDFDVLVVQVDAAALEDALEAAGISRAPVASYAQLRLVQGAKVRKLKCQHCVRMFQGTLFAGPGGSVRVDEGNGAQRVAGFRGHHDEAVTVEDRASCVQGARRRVCSRRAGVGFG
jgi:AraC-binding-like domain